MKGVLLIAWLVMVTFGAFSQDLAFEVKGAYARPVRAEKLEKATTMGDLIDGYPSSWITEYVSTGIQIVSDQKVNQALSFNEQLTPEQISLLKSARLGDEVVIDIKYKSRNFISKNLDERLLHYTATVIPEQEAEYPGGREPMKAYLQENAIRKIPNESFKELQQVIFLFTVDEHGQVINARITTTSSDPKTDTLLLEALNNMPKWKPAENRTGIKVTQDFELIVGNTGC
ncbi:MAG: energy transducer TonB [Saprospiraceae bacterium]|nr:energy transducer TonB [Candidatus Opimibacter skivensis]